MINTILVIITMWWDAKFKGLLLIFTAETKAVIL